MEPEKAVDLARKIAEGMAYCHELGVIHRDLKPENIILTSEGQPVIMDFGLALTKGSHRVTYSNLTAAAGTPDYMAPEQIEGQRGDPQTDVYALGTILYEMLSGKTPFAAITAWLSWRSTAGWLPPGQIQPASPHPWRHRGAPFAARSRRSLSRHAH
jgi:serine/threonine-protein kinase